MKKLYIINIVAIALVAIAVISYRAFLPPTTGAAGGGYENRNVVTIEEFNAKNWFNGSFTDSVTKCFTDTLPRRNDLIDAVTKIKSFYGEEIEWGIKPIDLTEPDKKNDIKPDNPNNVFDPLENMN